MSSNKRSTRAPTVTRTTITLPPSLSFTPGTSVAINLSVLVVLLLFAIVLYMFINWRRNKRDHTSPFNTEQFNNRQLEHTADDYEEIKDYNIRADIHTIYKNITLPVDPSESPAGLEHTAEDLNEINNMELYPELVIPPGPRPQQVPLDSPADLTQSHESQCSVSSSAIQEMNE